MYPLQDPNVALSLAHGLENDRLQDAELRRLARRSRSARDDRRAPGRAPVWQLPWRLRHARALTLPSARLLGH
jgi:hypothetical protein